MSKTESVHFANLQKEFEKTHLLIRPANYAFNEVTGFYELNDSFKKLYAERIMQNREEIIKELNQVSSDADDYYNICKQDTIDYLQKIAFSDYLIYETEKSKVK